MPELPEVETVRRGLADGVVGRTIIAVTVHERRLRRPLAPSFASSLVGRRIRGVRRIRYPRRRWGQPYWLVASGALRAEERSACVRGSSRPRTSALTLFKAGPVAMAAVDEINSFFARSSDPQ